MQVDNPDTFAGQPPDRQAKPPDYSIPSPGTATTTDGVLVAATRMQIETESTEADGKPLTESKVKIYGVDKPTFEDITAIINPPFSE